MAAEFFHTDEFRGATFRQMDFRGAVFHACRMGGVRVIGSDVEELNISVFSGDRAAIVVEDVDVSGYVSDELDRRFPERRGVRTAQSVAELAAVLDTLDRLWADTRARAERLPEPVRNERVDGEWSFVETLRHLVFAIDVWIGRMLPETAAPFHPLGLPPTDYPAEQLSELGLDAAARPPYDEVVAAFTRQLGATRAAVLALSPAELDRIRTGVPAPAWGEESYPGRACVRIVLKEMCEHRRYAVRDLAVLETRS
jgi:hypothetical protein